MTPQGGSGDVTIPQSEQLKQSIDGPTYNEVVLDAAAQICPVDGAVVGDRPRCEGWAGLPCAAPKRECLSHIGQDLYIVRQVYRKQGLSQAGLSQWPHW